MKSKKHVPHDPLHDFLSTRKILIVDSNGPARAGMARMLVGLGAKSKNLTLVADYEVAREIMHAQPPEVIVTEYNINKGNGLDLANEFNKTRIAEQTLFVMITSNSSQSIVSEAAEENVDIYVLKPYTMNYLLERLTRAIKDKSHPSPYSKAINDGKRYLTDAKLDEALHEFNRAIPLNPVPCLAYYYRAQVEIEQVMLDLAEQSLRAGLSFNEVHYKCLTGLFDLLLERNKSKEAYSIVQQLSAFPLNPKRLSKVIELAVKTANYRDIEKYYDAFKEIEFRDDEVIKHICAALVVSGRMLFQKGDLYRAADLLKKASVSAAGRPNILLEIVVTLVLNDFIPDAEQTIKRFPPDTQTEFQYQVANFMVAHAVGANAWQYVTWLRKQIEHGTNDPIVYYWTIASLQASGKADLAEDYLATSSHRWPDKIDYFQKALTAIPIKIAK